MCLFRICGENYHVSLMVTFNLLTFFISREHLLYLKLLNLKVPLFMIIILRGHQFLSELLQEICLIHGFNFTGKLALYTAYKKNLFYSQP